MKTASIALIVSLLTLTASIAGAQEATDWRKVAEAIPLGTKVKVHTGNGQRVTGTLMRVDDTSMMLKRNTRLPEPAVTLTFDRVWNIERDNGAGMHWAKAVGIGLGAGAGVILTMFIIAFQLD